MKNYTIYKITNLVNNKIYVGRHCTDNIDDGYMGSSFLLNCAIKKYGVDKFKKEILYNFDNEHQMNEMEASIVDEEFLSRSDVYNVSPGGTGHWSRNASIKGGKIGGLVAFEKKIGCYSKEARNKAIQTQIKNKIGLFNPEKKWHLGNIHSLKARKKISISQTGNRNSQFGSRWMNKGSEVIKVHSSDIEVRLSLGWIFGRKIAPVA